MNYDRSSKKEKWTFMKYVRSFDQIVTYAKKIRELQSNINGKTLVTIQSEFENIGIYNPRFGKKNRSTLICKIRHLVYFMFGYTERIEENLKFIFSPLGNLLLDNYGNKDATSRIFLSMLFSIEFHHPFNKMSDEFQLYPFRILFQLLNDERLDGKLYNDEVFYYVVFIKKINKSIYEELVKDILEFRKLTCEEKYLLFKKNESVIADSLHLWRYTVGTLEDADIFYNHKTNNISYGNLIQGKDTKRTYRYEYVTINENIKNFICTMLDNYPYYEDTVMSNKSLFKSDKISELYNFYPKELIEELGLENDKKQEDLVSILSLTKQIESTSYNTNKNDCYTFEDVLALAMNYFSDVRAEKIGGAGNTDVECIYLEKNQKFDIEAKSRKYKLDQINAGRLKEHRHRVGSMYTIVVTPDYVPAVKNDIKDENIVIIKSRTFSNLMYQLNVKYGRNIKYGFLNKIIINNLGCDISPKIDNYICENLSNTVPSNLLY